MPTFSGADHCALSVTDIHASERFYTEVLGFLTVLDFGYGRICLHKSTGFTIGLVQHPNAAGGSFTELNTGLDHLGFAVTSRDELIEWEQRFREHGVEFTPIRDMELGAHLNFRDPDGIALEFTVSSDAYAAARAMLSERDVPDSEVLEVAAQLLGPQNIAEG